MKEIFLTPDTFDAYLELMVGTVAIHVPQVQNILRTHFSYGDIHSSFPKETVRLDVPKILDGVNRSAGKLPTNCQATLVELNRIFLISTYAVLQETATYPQITGEPVIQFYRHVRNACAHYGRFNFSGISLPARWRDKEITTALIGKSVFPDFLNDGDVWLLLLDICAQFYIPIGVRTESDEPPNA